MDQDQPPDGLTPELAQTVLRQGEVFLQTQLQMALAADQRAVTMAAILIAASMASFGFAAEQMGGEFPHLRFAFSLALQGVALFGAGALCVMAAWPMTFAVAGADPRNWWSDDVTDQSYEECLWRESINYSQRIARNNAAMKRNNKLLRAGLVEAIAAPLVGLAAWKAYPLLF